ncbi:PIN domain-containing protein [Pseudomonas syringae]|uniref:PIN domain-containing protein n=2 Tax=Pseudomonas syringae TaxID=317 RepID=UPI003204A81D
MWVVLDTNIYFNQWLLEGANFRVFRNFCNNTGAKLLLPEIVRQEVQNKYDGELSQARTELERLATKFGKLGVEGLPSSVSGEEYDFGQLVREQYRSVSMVEYSSVSHDQLVHKALTPKLPFREKEKGYRDALLWLSILDYVKASDFEGPIHFINANSKDFYSSKSGDVTLHDDLKEDLHARGMDTNVIPYVSLSEFVVAHVLQELHDVDWQEFYSEFNGELDDNICVETIAWLDERSLTVLREKLVEANYPSYIMDGVFAATFEAWEGIEDSDIVTMRKIDEDRYFIEYAFDIRVLEIKLLSSPTAHTQGYLGAYIDVEVDNDLVTTSFFTRADFKASVVFNITRELVEDIDVTFFKLRSR